MGACGSSPDPADAANAQASKAIDRANREAYSQEQAKIKLLLLGAGESGKSTIFKQMRILYGSGFEDQSAEERERWEATVAAGILLNMKIVLSKVEAFEDESLTKKVQGFKEKSTGNDAHIDVATGELMKAFWADSAVQETWHIRATFQVQDSLKYYMDNMDRIMANDYVPSPADILHTRVRTSGIVEENFVIDGVTFQLFDVGGQRNERKKWIHCFDNVTSIIFVAAISEFDQVLYEDETMNRMDEAVILFDEICNSPFFTSTSMILFLNKSDLFREKLAVVPFRVDEGPAARYTDYEGPVVATGTEIGSAEYEQAFEATKRYVLQLFVNRNKVKGKDIYHKVTCATDTDNVALVFSACKDIILQDNLKASGFAV